MRMLLAFLAGYTLAVFTWPHLRAWLIKFRSDPVGIIEADIAKAKAQLDAAKARL